MHRCPSTFFTIYHFHDPKQNKKQFQCLISLIDLTASEMAAMGSYDMLDGSSMFQLIIV